MRIAHVIFAYKDPAQIERLINAMRHPEFDIYIHLDKKIPLAAFEYLAQLPQVKFIKNRILCNWGGFSLVQAMLRSIDEIQENGIKYDFINLLSGQDYPLKPTNEIYDFFNQKLGYSFIAYEESRDSKWWMAAESRYKHFHFTDFAFLGRYRVQHILNKILPERKFPGFTNLYGGATATWSTLSYDAAIYLSAYFKKNPRLSRFLKFTWACDEFILITILMNSGYKDKVINNNYRYIEFPEGKSQPRILGKNDFDLLTRSNMLFARKFDIKVDTAVLDKIDSEITAKADKYNAIN